MKLSEYVETAAREYLQETASDQLDACWVAEFFTDAGVQDAYPRQDLVGFAALVQKALAEKSEKAGKHTRFQLARIVALPKPPRKS